MISVIINSTAIKGIRFKVTYNILLQVLRT